MIEEATASVRGTVAGRTQPPGVGRFVLGRRASLLVSAGVVGHTLWTSAAPALTYGLYAEEWHLSHTMTAGIFAIYPIGVVVMLVGFGSISDQIGRRATMLAGLFASLIGALLFAVAPDVWWVFAGRALMGIGVGLAASPSTAAILEFSSLGSAKHAASVTMGAQAGGFAAALLLGGALTEYAPWPTRLCFWVLALFLIVLVIGTWHLPRRKTGGAGGDWRSRMPSVPKPIRWAFAVSSTAMVAAYTFGVLVLSLGGQVEHDLIGSPNAFLNSAVLSLFPIVMAAIGIIARTLSPRTALIAGALVSCLGMVLLMLAVNFRDLVVYLLATAAAGGAYSLLFVGGLQVISMAVTERNRGGVLSALYLLGYLSMGALALVLGAIATTRGLDFAVDLGAVAIILMNAATLVLAMITPSQMLGPPVVGEFDAIGKKVEEDTDPQRQEPNLPKIDSMQFVDVARIERLEDRDETIGGNIILDYERGQPNEADIIEGERPQRIAIAGLDISGWRDRSLHASLGQKATSSPLGHS
ncbi:Predicted arabinose efflux permease, MFS family [Bradyrhizobium erythrophlei]|uniref:Predicted arabinose efflux permease, MFS family n=1 Tax=Bradyrhizobium erythrophlei TaxID=1437360 RepID=A0A1H5HRG5_9BRAD|nr:MFS transporter [Bradyrhizobium erythrophlei]SEE30509.1 Predicted arabinose efflux permease, MFS family [Bradyrhizobium erythrophlei]